MRELLLEPLWRPEDLGRPIPASPHAISVCLPTWQDTIGYEEHDPRVVNRLQSGYPRFVYHPICRELFAHCRRQFDAERDGCQVYSSLSSAERFQEFIERATGQRPRAFEAGACGATAVFYSEHAEKVAKQYWQHTGEGVSSRRAEAILAGRTTTTINGTAQVLQERIAGLVGIPENCVFLFPNGMAAIATLHRCLKQICGDRKSVQFGFPYVDTLKIQEKFGCGAHLFAAGDDAGLAQLEEAMRREPIGPLFTEFPSNPLLTTPDLAKLSELARHQGVPLIVDETIASYINADVLSVADAVTTSLSKFFSGVGDVMGGAVILNPRSDFHGELSQRLESERGELLWDADLEVLERNSRDFRERVLSINAGAEILANFLNDHQRIRRVYYPQLTSRDLFTPFQRPGAGYGGLLSFTLHDEARTAPRIFDALRVCKGPNLGMSYTLACPYTLLAHYDELDFVESCGMSRWLIRVSVGVEEPGDLIRRFEAALVSV